MTGGNQTRGREYWPGLDGLRGVAILLVVVAHTGFFLGPLGGQVGVTLFFVLSGFLITSILIAELHRSADISLKAFYKRRAVRLLPALLLFLVIGSLLIDSLYPEFKPLVAAVPALFYFANYAFIAGYPLPPNEHLWSLSVEEHFYLVWPIVLSLRRSIPRSRTLFLWAAGLLILRLGVGLFSPLWSYHGSVTNSYALVAGCALGAAHAEGVRLRFPRYFAMLAVFLMTMIAAWRVPSLEVLLDRAVWVPPIVTVLGAVAIWGLINQPSGLFEARWLRYVGTISYGWYLWHAPFLFLSATNDTLTKRLAVAAGTFLIAAASWHFLESPILRKSRARTLTKERTGVRL